MKSSNSKVVSQRTQIKEIKKIIEETLLASYGFSETVSGSNKKGKEEIVSIRFHSNKTFDVEVRVTSAYGVKITEALCECQKLIVYTLNKKYPKQCNKVNVYAIGISDKY